MFQIDITELFKKGFISTMFILQFYLSFLFLTEILKYNIQQEDFLHVKGIDFIVKLFLCYTFFYAIIAAAFDFFLKKIGKNRAEQVEITTDKITKLNKTILKYKTFIMADNSFMHFVVAKGIPLAYKYCLTITIVVLQISILESKWWLYSITFICFLFSYLTYLAVPVIEKIKREFKKDEPNRII